MAVLVVSEPHRDLRFLRAGSSGERETEIDTQTLMAKWLCLVTVGWGVSGMLILGISEQRKQSKDIPQLSYSRREGKIPRNTLQLTRKQC